MTSPRSIRLGTRGSALARRQSAIIRTSLETLWPGAPVTEVVLSTAGDADETTPLPEIGGEGVFTSALERALRADEIDLAVHSLKDVPTSHAELLSLRAICLREDPRDVLVARNGWTLETLPRGARVGTCSVRRSAQLLAARPDVTLLPLRGNVDTRVRQVQAGAFDAIVLAAAGLHRLGLHAVVTQYLPLEQMLPAPGQGALAVQCRADDIEIVTSVAALDDPVVRAATDAERAFLEGLGGGCTAPIAAFADAVSGRLRLRTIVASADGQHVLRLEECAPVAEGRALGLLLASRARERGAEALLA